MKIINIRYLDNINLFLNLHNNEKFVIIYLIKILNKPLLNYKIKNKKNILYENDKKIELNMNGLLFKINIEINNIYIYTINKYDKKNNVIDIHIDKNNMIGYILSYNAYKKYSKNNILQLAIYIMSIYHDKKIINEVIIDNNCFFNKTKNLLSIFYFYTNMDKYINYKYYIEPFLINESFYDKLNRLNIYKINISKNMINDNELYDCIINNKNYNKTLNKDYSNEIIQLIQKENIEYINKCKKNKNIFLETYFRKLNNKIFFELKLFNKYKPLTKDIHNHIDYLKKYDKTNLNNYIELNYYKIIDEQNKNKLVTIFNINNFESWIKNIKKKYIIWNKNINENIFFLNFNKKEKIICIELLEIIYLFTMHENNQKVNLNELKIFDINFIDINNIIFYSKIFSKNIFVL